MATYKFTSGGFADVTWTVLRVTGEEALSTLYSFAVTVAADTENLDHLVQQRGGAATVESVAIQQAASFTLSDDPNAISRFGLVVGVTVLGVVPATTAKAEATVVRFEVAPSAWLLQHRRRSRVFQSRYMHEIVSTVLTEMGVRHRFVLNNSYPKRPYAVQFDETDWSFVTRLLAEEGVFFFFEHGAFTAGDAAGVNVPLTDWQKAKKYGASVSKLAGVAMPLVTGNRPSGNKEGAIASGIGALGALGDLLAGTAPDDDFDDAPWAPGSGQGGPDGPGDVLVFCDRPLNGYVPSLRSAATTPVQPGMPSVTGLPMLPGMGGAAATLTLTLRGPEGMVADANNLRMFVPRRTIRPVRTHLRDYWFMKPLLDLSVHSSPATDPGTLTSPDLEVYFHHGEFDRPDVNPENAGLHLDQYRADLAVYFGEGGQPEIGPGVLFKYESSVRSVAPVDANYAVVRVRHDWVLPDDGMGVDALLALVTALEAAPGLVPGPAAIGPGGATLSGGDATAIAATATTGASLYTARFECVPGAVAFRPPRPKRAPRTSIELATVVGPIGEDIYTDPFGRIRIQFHWDREGEWKPSSSCWVRVAQAWAGAGFGTMFLPRVGMEVVVAFVGGDPDRPVVVGTLYNGIHPTPEPLPDRRTRSGIRTQLSPEGGDGNELGFEDDKENARVFLRAQKDYELRVGDNSTTSVKNDDVKTVGGDLRVGVQGDRILGVGGSRAALVSESDSLQVGGDKSTRVSRNESTFVEGDAITSVGGVAVSSVDVDALHMVAGDRTVRVDGNSMTHVGGKERDGHSHAVTFVEGGWILGATADVVVTADAGGKDGDTAKMVLRCGNSSITLERDQITIKSKKVLVAGTDSVELHGEHSLLTLDKDGFLGQGKTVRLEVPHGTGTMVIGDASASIVHRNCLRLWGADIHLTTGRGADYNNTPDQPRTPPTPNVTLHLTDEEQCRQGKDLPAGCKWRVLAADGQDFEAEGALEGGGLLKVYVPTSVDSIDVFVWPDASLAHAYPPDQGPLMWKVHLVTDLGTMGSRADAPPATSNAPAPMAPPNTAATVKAARIRLRNLGYLPLAELEKAEMDEATAAAVRRFQRDQKLKVSDADDGPDPLNQETITKLQSVYGS